MSKELEALHILYDKYATDDEFLEDDRLFSTIERGLNVLNMFKDALVIEHAPSYATLGTMHNVDGSVEVEYKTTYDIIRKGLETELKKELTKWVIENIDKETIRKWLEK